MKTSIVILTYNKLNYTKLCIESIRKFTAKSSYEIIVVDNNSTDGTTVWLKQQKDIKVICNKENLGFPKGCNQGIEIAKGDSILLLNNDTVVTHNWLDNLRNCLFSSPDIGAVGAITNNCSYYQAIPVSYKNLQDMHGFAKKINVKDPGKWEDRLKLVGYCMLIKREVSDKIGLLDEQFTPGNYEDDDYSLRIRKAGYRLVLCNDTFIHHFGSISFKENADKYNNLLETNRTKFKEKWGFDPNYSTFVRQEIIDLIDYPAEAEIKVLEVGCACGGTLLKIKHLFKNADLYGVELNDCAAENAAAFAEVKIENIESGQIDYPDNYFDYIILADVLEHLINPWTVLQKLTRFAKPDGKILASVPNVMHYTVIKNLLAGSWTYEDAGILDKTHLRFFTLNEISKMFREAGCTNLEFTAVTLTQSEEDDPFIESLSALSSQNLSAQLKTYQYLIKGNAKDKTYILRNLISDISNDVNTDKNMANLTHFTTDEIISTVCDWFENKINILNLLAIKFFELEKHDQVLPYLQRAFQINNRDTDTLFNLGYVLYTIGEKDLALQYLEMIENPDDEVIDLMAKIKE